MMIIYIKNMVCLRCEAVVRFELEKAGLHVIKVSIGQASISEDHMSKDQSETLNEALIKTGLELSGNRKEVLVEKIKAIIIELVNGIEIPSNENFSNYLSKRLKHSYTYLAKIFHDITGRCIEKYMISQRIERVKELLEYNELNLTQISYLLHYSSVAHLSTQFKKITGMNATDYVINRSNLRIASDKI